MRRHSPTNIWPGFVDAISTILIIILFLLMVFTLAQHFLTKTLSGRDQALSRLTQQVAELSELLAIEKNESAELRSRIDQLGIDLENTVSERDTLKNQLVVSRQEEQNLAEALMISETKLSQTTLELASSYKEIEV
ncbi:MAG: chemotaxis protein, partial [Pseudomonadota bacterium]|nr:chemotaxis protein [Pseudomonadota bacterium]